MSDKFVVVTTLSHFKLKYAIPADEFNKLFPEPVDTTALAEQLNSGRIKEFSQAHLGEVVADVAELERSDILQLFDADNAYLSGWSEEQKMAWISKWQVDDF